MKIRGSKQLEILGLVCLSVEVCLVSSFSLPVLCQESPSIPRIPPTENRTKKMALTDHEKQIAKELGFDESVLLLIKERLNPEMGIVKSGGLEGEDRTFLEEDYNQPLLILDKDAKNYSDIASKYPELKKVVESERPHSVQHSIEQHFADSDVEQGEELGPERFERMKRYRAAAEPFRALMAEELQDTHGRPKSGMVYLHSEPAKYLDSDEALNEAIAELHTKYDGKALRPENRASLMLALKYKGVGDFTHGPDRRMAALRAELNDLGYRINDERTISAKRVQFETKAEAEQYLRESGTSIDSISLSEQKKSVYKAIYPIDYAKDLSSLENAKTIIVQSSSFMTHDDDGTTKMAEMMLQHAGPLKSAFGHRELCLMPGSTVSRAGAREWLVTRPERFTAVPILRASTVIKVPKNNSGFDMVRAQGTNGINSGIDNEGVIEKLKYWDKKYGVTVIEATFDTVKVRFKSLPDDLSELCTEFFLFGPEIELSDDEHRNAAVMREIADELRKTHETTFWWD